SGWNPGILPKSGSLLQSFLKQLRGRRQIRAVVQKNQVICGIDTTFAARRYTDFRKYALSGTHRARNRAKKNPPKRAFLSLLGEH
ncbi:hypothetical protein, partial [Stutzerimonas kunmingensis]|uniref:hypothetical protein n=1 Tax=Stutzerimonas kunmingensis TaxID=1211807 RepID=UPI0028AD7F5F